MGNEMQRNLGGAVVVFNASTSSVEFVLNTNKYNLQANKKQYKYIAYHTDPIPRSSAKDPGRENVFGTKNTLFVSYPGDSSTTFQYNVCIDPDKFSFEEDLQIYLFIGQPFLIRNGTIVDGGVKPIKSLKKPFKSTLRKEK